MRYKPTNHRGEPSARLFIPGQHAQDRWRERIGALSDATARAETTRHRAREAYEIARNLPTCAALARCAHVSKAHRRALFAARALADGKPVTIGDYQAASRIASRLPKADQKKTPTPSRARAVFKKAKRARFRADDAPAVIRRAYGEAPPGPKPYAVRAMRALAHDLSKLADWIDVHRMLETHASTLPDARTRRTS
jgi:hypothetical protein